MRHSEQCQGKRQLLSSDGRRWRRKAPSIQPISNPPLPAALPAHPATLRRAQRHRSATGAAVWPRQGPAPPHRSGGRRPAPRCGGSSRTSPTLPLHTPAPTCHRDGIYSRPPSRRTGHSYHPRPHQGGAPQRHHRHPPQSFPHSLLLLEASQSFSTVILPPSKRRSFLKCKPPKQRTASRFYGCSSRWGSA